MDHAWLRTVTRILWPALLVTSALDAFLLLLIDPVELGWIAGTVGWSPAGVYAVGFMVSWAAASVLSVLVLLGGFLGQTLARSFARRAMPRT